MQSPVKASALGEPSVNLNPIPSTPKIEDGKLYSYYLVLLVNLANFR